MPRCSLSLSVVIAVCAAVLSPSPARAAPLDSEPVGRWTAGQGVDDALTAIAASSPHLGPALSAIVVDADGAAEGSVVWRHNAGRVRMPASAQKLLTAFTVLESMDVAETLPTRTCRTPGAPSAVYVRGGGDPSLSVARLRALATSTAAALKQSNRTRVELYLDASVFPAPTSAPGWPARYLRSDVQPVRGLTMAGYRGADGRAAVGKALTAGLGRQGVTARVVGFARTPSACAQLAEVRSPTVGRLVAQMLAHSDNDYAEALLRHAALARGGTPSWQGALEHQRAVLARAGIPVTGLQVFDGSGLSRANRMPVQTLAAVLTWLRRDPNHAAVVFAWGALPQAGRTGTLRSRFGAPQHACARGRVQAKTGTLADATSLAGVARGADGRDRVFVFLQSGPRSGPAVRTALDALATAVVGCRAAVTSSAAGAET